MQFSMVAGGVMSPYAVMMEVLQNERYAAISTQYRQNRKATDGHSALCRYLSFAVPPQYSSGSLSLVTTQGWLYIARSASLVV